MQIEKTRNENSTVNQAVEGKNVLIVGRSKLVGSPLAKLLTDNDATVTLAHSKTKDLKGHCLNADIIISATGMPSLIKKEYIKDGTWLIDVGIAKDKNGNLCGDIEKGVKNAEFITPVPGGVGPMTVAMLMENVMQAYDQRKKNKAA